ncbi:hypothetical protein NW755_007056 [Fusarium falciforme]|uniref:Uncharacterized protein n=1 Tax=Fusarium falciforme TaxID=195108 RepID=A0A9W8R7Y5_9HYPO|nr:hypothetical protein NW755_007056 [Fusarium falciforme]
MMDSIKNSPLALSCSSSSLLLRCSALLCSLAFAPAPTTSKMVRRSRRLALLRCAVARRRRLATLRGYRIVRILHVRGFMPTRIQRVGLAANQFARARHVATRRMAEDALSGDTSLMPQANGGDFFGDDDDDDYEREPDTDSGLGDE